METEGLGIYKVEASCRSKSKNHLQTASVDGELCMIVFWLMDKVKLNITKQVNFKLVKCKYECNKMTIFF